MRTRSTGTRSGKLSHDRIPAKWIATPAASAALRYGLSLLLIGMTFGPSRRERLPQSEAYLAEAQKVSHTGSIFWHILSGKIYWSDETFRIFEFPPATPPALELMFERIILKTGDLFGI